MAKRIEDISEPIQTPKLDELIELALRKFNEKEVYNCRTDGGPELTSYGIIDATYDAVDDIRDNGVNPIDLIRGLISETSFRPDNTEVSMVDFAWRGFENWEEFFYSLSQVIIYSELIKAQPEIVEEDKRRYKKYDDPDD